MSPEIWRLGLLSVLLSACSRTPPPPPPTLNLESARAAVRSFRRQPDTAGPALAFAATENPRIASALNTLRGEALLAAGQPDEAAILARAVVAEDPPWAGRAAWTLARALPDAASLEALATLATVRPDAQWAPAAAILTERARRLSISGQTAAAESTLRRLRIEHPNADLPGPNPAPVLTPEERLAQAHALERARHHLQARAAYKALLATPKIAERARFALAKLHLERLRDDYALAHRLLAAVEKAGGADAEEAAYLQAKALGRAGRLEEAVAAYRAFAKRYSASKRAVDARFFAAFLLYEARQYPAAQAAFAALSDGRWARASGWYRAWCAYLEGADFPRAAKLLDAQAAKARQGSRRWRRALYWAAKAREHDAPAKAKALRMRLVADDANDWYALLIRRRFPKDAEPTPGLMPSAQSAESAGSTPDRPAPPEIATIEQLAAAGLYRFSRLALARQAGALRRAGENALLIRLSEASQDWRRVFRRAVSRHRGLFDRFPKPADAAAWRGAYPQGFAPFVVEATARTGLSAAWAYSFIRKESAFAPNAISPAHAVGLMQLLPKTARALRPAGPAPDLFDPRTNVSLGVEYAQAISSRFGGQLPLVAAAYNAGPAAVTGWFGSATMADVDRFVEHIVFKETRGYVKRMVETVVRYRMIWQGMSAEAALEVLPLRLDLTRRAGVDF